MHAIIDEYGNNVSHESINNVSHESICNPNLVVHIQGKEIL